MPITRRLLLAFFASLALSSNAFAQERVQVVATFSVLGDLVAEIGGDRVDVNTLVGPDGDAHVYQPSPADARAIAAAAVIVLNGLGFEGWMDRLIDASGTRAAIVIAAQGVNPIAFDTYHDEHHYHHDHPEGAGNYHNGHHGDHAADAGHDGHDHGALDPHAWQSATNVALYVGNIERAFAAVDPGGAAAYAANANAYLAELDALDAEIRSAVAALPRDRRTVVTSHDAFGYFARDYGLTFIAPQGISTEAEASAREVAALIRQIRDQDISAVFVENITDRRLLEQIAAETRASIGGTLYSDALSGPEGPAATYLAMMRHNLAQLTAALTK